MHRYPGGQLQSPILIAQDGLSAFWEDVMVVWLLRGSEMRLQ